MLVENEQSRAVVDLKQYCEKFMEQLEAQSYAEITLKSYKLRISHFCERFENCGLGLKKLNVSAIQRLIDVILSETKESIRKSTRFHLGRFMNYLIENGIICRPVLPEKDLTALEHLKVEYRAYLREQRGLSKSTIRLSMYCFEQFMTFCFGDTLGDFNTITSKDVSAFLRKVLAGRGSQVTHLRSLLKFLFWSGKTLNNLANSVPRIAHPQSKNLPRSLNPEDIRRLIDSVKTDDAIGRRNYAMLLIASRLGLRSPEITAIQLEDIDWRAGEILIRGKGKYLDCMSLPIDVGEAIVDYIQRGRRGNSRALFVRNRAPYQPFKNAQVVNAILRKAFEKTGLKSPQKHIGAHVLRHSLAVDMLRKGAPLGEISDVLRHRSRESTLIYAKHNVDELRSLARPWPKRGGVK